MVLSLVLAEIRDYGSDTENYEFKVLIGKKTAILEGFVEWKRVKRR